MDQFLTFAHQLADAAGEAIRPYFGQHGSVENKSDNSPVTQADRAAEQAMRDLIAKHFPDHGIYGEEFGTTHHSPLPTHQYTWVLDPIDGTRAFIAEKKEWGTLIALCENGIPIIGILNQPITGERWIGVRGDATRYIPSPLGGGLGRGHHESSTEQYNGPHPTSPLKGEEIKTRACASLSTATISTTSANYFTPVQARNFVKLADQCTEVIENGDCYAYGLLARGERDLVVDAGLKPYDILALVPIIQGAGGKITAWDGTPITLTNFSTALAAGDPKLHQEALLLLQPAV